MLQVLEIGLGIVTEPALLPPRFPSHLQLRAPFLPVLNIARAQHQAFVRPSRVASPEITRAEPITTRPGDPRRRPLARRSW